MFTIYPPTQALGNPSSTSPTMSLVLKPSSLIVCGTVPYQKLQANCSRNGVEAAITLLPRRIASEETLKRCTSHKVHFSLNGAGGVGSTRLILSFVACRLSALPAPCPASHWVPGATRS